MSRVYVLAEPTRRSSDGQLPDLSALERYGELVFVFPTARDPRFKTAHALATARNVMTDFDPATDYIAFAGGETLGVFLAGTIVADMSAGQGWTKCRWLRYERATDPTTGRRTNKGATYTPIWLDLTET